jgi:structural maintenance of chromosome 2
LRFYYHVLIVIQQETSLDSKRKQIEDFDSNHAANAEQHSTAQAALTRSEELLQSLLTGLTNSSAGTGGGYMGQLADARARLAREAAEEEQLRRKLNMTEKELAEVTKKWKAVEREASEMQSGLEKGHAEFEGMKAKFAKLAWDEAREKAAEEKMASVKQNVRELKEVLSIFPVL